MEAEDEGEVVKGNSVKRCSSSVLDREPGLVLLVLEAVDHFLRLLPLLEDCSSI